MTNKEAIEQLKELRMWMAREFGVEPNELDRESIHMAIEALEKTADKECSRCQHRNRCSIFDNFNIDYCSDWSEEE